MRMIRSANSRMVSSVGSNRKTIVHPEVGPIALDCDVLTVALDNTVRVLKVVGFSERRGDATAARVLYEDLQGRQKRISGAEAGLRLRASCATQTSQN